LEFVSSFELRASSFQHLMDRVGFALYRLVGIVVGMLPLKAGFCLGAALGWIGYFFAGPYRRLVMRNLTIALGREKSHAELRTIARKHFTLLGANLFASLKLPRLSRAELESVVTVDGIETMDAGTIANGGFVMVISHLGNWEMFAQLTPIIFRCKVGTIFQALGNPYNDAEVRRDRARLGLELFERKEGFVKACQFMREGGAVGVLVDQHAGDAGLWCPFFGRLASTSTLAATLALRTGAWLVPAAVYTDGIARWRCVIRGQMKPKEHDAERITARINVIMEDKIRRQPEDWFWVHNRWKTPKPKFLLATYKRGVCLPGAMVDGEWDILSGEDHDELSHESQAAHSPSLQPFRIVIRSSNWLGDAVMSVPAVRAIKRGRPDAHVTILTPAKLGGMWKSVAGVDEVLPIDAGESVFGVASKLRRGNFDVAIVFPNSLRTALEPWLGGVPRRVGRRGHHRALLLDQIYIEKKKRPTAPRHQVHDYLALAAFVGADVRKEDAELPTTTRVPRPRDWKPILGVCPGAEYGPAKRWPADRFAAVMEAAHERTGCECKLFGVVGDRPIGDAIMAGIEGAPVSDLIGKTSLAQLMDELQTCDVLLTNDTGTMHLAAMLGVPTVSIFGSTEPALTGPLGASHHVIRHHVACSPCFLRECPIDFRCMNSIAVEEALAAVEAKLTA
jgi:lipopolysaccharide heptosyltransferase II